MKVTALTVTKNQDGSKTIIARVECVASQTVNIALPTFTNLGMTDKINTGSAKVLTSVERKHTEVIEVEITADEARGLAEEAAMFYGKDEMAKRYEQQSDTVTIIRL